MKINVTLSTLPNLTKFSINKLDMQQAQGACKLAEKLNENSGFTDSPTILIKVEH